MSPYHFKYGDQRDNKTTSAMRIGTAAHGFIVEPDHAARRHPVFGGKVRRGRDWDRFIADHPAVDPDDVLIASEREAVMSITKSVEGNTRAREYLTEGAPETSLFWTDEATGLRCKARPDVLSPTTIVDLKTTNGRNFGRDRLEAHALRSGWHIQIGHYVMGAKANGFELTRAVLVVAESTCPHDIAIFSLRPELVKLGMQQCRSALDIIAECERTNVWPGVDGGAEIELGVPEWVEPST
jgi:hypothetical protein